MMKKLKGFLTELSGVYWAMANSFPGRKWLGRGLALLFVPLYYEYVTVMAMYQHKDTLLGKVTFWPKLVVGGMVDGLTNVFAATLFFWDAPRELMLTQRFKRYRKTEPLSWRGRLAAVVCDQYLDRHDPSGDHC